MDSLMDRSVVTYAPRSAEEAAELFAECSRLKGQGADIRVGIAESPFRPGRDFEDLEETHNINNIKDIEDRIKNLKPGSEITVLASSKEMADITEISKEDRLAVVQGGVLLDEFKGRVKQEGLVFPLEPWIPRDDLTIAELIMDNEISDMEGAFGGLRESVLSLQMATPGGELIHTGSRAVKDVGGYEIAAFMLGMGGRCGMLTSATLRLHPEQVIANRKSEAASIEEHRQTLAPLLERAKEGGGFMHIAYDAGPEPDDSLNAIVCRSHFPERFNLFQYVDKEHALGGTGDLLRRILGAGLRERIVLFDWQEGKLRRKRISKDALLALLSTESGKDSAKMRKDRSILEEMNERVLEVFDPSSIMLP
jgi:hypothetical protein